MHQLDSAFVWLDGNHWGMNDRLELRTCNALAPIRNDPRHRDILRKAKIP